MRRRYLSCLWLSGALLFSLARDAQLHASPADDVPATDSRRAGERRAGNDWWSLQPVVRPAIPEVSDTTWARNAIDRFILQKLEQRSLRPAPAADAATLLRRAKLDLLGLPPTPDELDDFLADHSIDATVRLIDRLLASPSYGERWGRHWLDVVRFGESDGFENDKMREHAWRYRDYVIDSFNADKPYDRFVLEQLAGDVLDPITRAGIVATGFLVAGPWDEIQFVAKSPTERRRAREEQQEELLATVGQTFLGLTVHCARCHDHKFDPILQSDYYALKAVFDGVDHRTGEPAIDGVDRGNRSIFTPGEERAHQARIGPIQARIKSLKASLEKLGDRLPSDAVAVADDADALVTEGRFGQGMNGRRGYAQVKAKSAYQTPPFTVQCWAKLASKAGFNVLVANQPKESSEHWEIYTYAGSGEFSAFLPGYEPAEIKSGVDITDDRWHHVAMTFDGSVVQLIVDAKLARTASVKRLRNGGPSGMLWFGAYPAQRIGCTGSIDEVHISKSIRTIDRVPTDPPDSDEHTLGLWHFDSLDGRRFADAVRPIDDELRRSVRDQEDALRAQLKEAETQLAAEPVPVTYVGVRRQPDPTVVYLRGDIQKPGPEVVAASPSAVQLPNGESFALPGNAAEAQRRLRFAQWVANPHNPLTARVMVNRIWHYHFGHGLVDTPSDFGFNGGHASHPELLDWLAGEFITSGFSVKHMHRLIMSSATYQQSSAFNSNAAELDAENLLVWRFTPRRLEAETVRDAMLATSGEISWQMGGPSFRPFTTTERNTQFYHLIDDGRPDFNRRTIYRMNVNTGKDPLLDSLDCPAPSITAPKRRSTTTTLQSLALMNDSFVVRQSERFAERLRQTAGPDTRAQIRAAYRIALARDPTADDLPATVHLVADHGLHSACWALFNSSEFLHVR